MSKLTRRFWRHCGARSCNLGVCGSLSGQAPVLGSLFFSKSELLPGARSWSFCLNAQLSSFAAPRRAGTADFKTTPLLWGPWRGAGWPGGDGAAGVSVAAAARGGRRLVFWGLAGAAVGARAARVAPGEARGRVVAGARRGASPPARRRARAAGACERLCARRGEAGCPRVFVGSWTLGGVRSPVAGSPSQLVALLTERKSGGDGERRG